MKNKEIHTQLVLINERLRLLEGLQETTKADPKMIGYSFQHERLRAAAKETISIISYPSWSDCSEMSKEDKMLKVKALLENAL